MVHPYAARTVLFGIRPEDLYERPPGHLKDRFETLTGRVATVEALGAETLLVMGIEGVKETFRARLDRDCAVQTGETISLFINLDAVHLFDPETTRAIPCKHDSNT